MITWNQVSAFVTKPAVLVPGACAFSFAAGATLSYFLTEKKVSKEYQEYVEKEIKEAREYYKRLHKTDEYETPESAAEALLLQEAVKVMWDYQGLEPKSVPPVSATYEVPPVPPEVTSELPTINNVFDRNGTNGVDFDYSAEVNARTTNAPYIISHIEFMESDLNYDQITLTYFAGDKVLVNEREEPVDDVRLVIGDNNLRFGHRSNDNRVVYIRNDKLRVDLEVILHDGMYSEIIAGFVGSG